MTTCTFAIAAASAMAADGTFPSVERLMLAPVREPGAMSVPVREPGTTFDPLTARLASLAFVTAPFLIFWLVTAR